MAGDVQNPPGNLNNVLKLRIIVLLKFNPSNTIILEKKEEERIRVIIILLLVLLIL